MPSALDELIGRLDAMPEKDRVVVTEGAIAVTSGMKWIPNPGPQTEAYFSKADVLLYGGQAAGGKSDLLGGLALMKHRRSLIMRRQYTDLGALIERLREIDATYDGFNGSPPPRLRTADGRLIDFGAAAQLGDERHWQGQPHDLLGIEGLLAPNEVEAAHGTLPAHTTGRWNAEYMFAVAHAIAQFCG